MLWDIFSFVKYVVELYRFCGDEVIFLVKELFFLGKRIECGGIEISDKKWRLFIVVVFCVLYL